MRDWALSDSGERPLERVRERRGAVEAETVGDARADRRGAADGEWKAVYVRTVEYGTD